MRQCYFIQNIAYRICLGNIFFQKLLSGRSIIKKISNHNSGSFGASGFCNFPDFTVGSITGISQF